jgi:hypothetical protein
MRLWACLSGLERTHRIAEEQLGDLQLRLKAAADESLGRTVDAYAIKDKADTVSEQIDSPEQLQNLNPVAIVEVLQILGVMSENADHLGTAMEASDTALQSAMHHLEEFIKHIGILGSNIKVAKEFFDESRKGQNDALDMLSGYLRRLQGSVMKEE